MWCREAATEAMVRVDPSGVGRARERVPQRGGEDVRGQCSERVRDQLRVPGGPEGAVDTPGPDRGKEVLQVQADDDELPGVFACVPAYGAAAGEAVGCLVRWDPVEQLA